MTHAVDRFERRLTEETSKLRVEIVQGDALLRQELAPGLAGVRQELATTRVELLKWSFLFWVGQVVAMIAILSVLLQR
jgi:hypothetical protein